MPKLIGNKGMGFTYTHICWNIMLKNFLVSSFIISDVYTHDYNNLGVANFLHKVAHVVVDCTT